MLLSIYYHFNNVGNQFVSQKARCQQKYYDVIMIELFFQFDKHIRLLKKSKIKEYLRVIYEEKKSQKIANNQKFSKNRFQYKLNIQIINKILNNLHQILLFISYIFWYDLFFDQQYFSRFYSIFQAKHFLNGYYWIALPKIIQLCYFYQISSSTQSRYSEASSYRTRNSRSNSRFRRNNNNRRYRRNNRYNNNRYYNNRNKRNYNYRNQQERNEEKSITNEMLKEQEKLQEQTCRYWQRNTCRNHECERKHFQIIKLMNMYYKPKSKRIKNNITDYNIIEKEIQKQEFTVQIEITRQMKIEEIQKFIVHQSQKLDQNKINNIKIKMAVKNNRKIIQEIEHIRNTTLLELEKNKETINLTQAELIATSEVLKEMQKQEFINIRETFIERNSEQEYQNQISREKHMKQLEQLKEQRQQNERQMEVEDNNIRISFNTNIFKPVIQENQFSNIRFGEQNQEKSNMTSEEDKVNKQNTSSGEDQNKMNEELRISQNILQNFQGQQQLLNESIPISTQKQEKTVNWQNIQVDTSQAIVQNNVHLLKESILIIEQTKNIKDIAFIKLNNKQLFKDYLTEQKVDINKDAKDIPTGAYLILAIDANYINMLKQRIKKDEDKNTLETRIKAFSEAISTHAISTIQYRLESDKIKLDSSRKLITDAVYTIIASEDEYTQENLQQVRVKTDQAININVIIHITFKFEVCKTKMEQLKNKEYK